MGKMKVKVIGGEVFDLPKRERAKKFDGETVIGLAVMLGDLRAEQERRESAGSGSVVGSARIAEIAARGSLSPLRSGTTRPRRSIAMSASRRSRS